jgi:uncharacterized membrane protein YesL
MQVGIFSPEGALYKFISRLWDVIVLNFMWILFSIPIVTIGASTVAAYSVCLKMVDEEEGYIAGSFVKAFKENIKQGIILGLITIAAIYIVYLNFALFNAIESNPLPLLIMGIMGSVVFFFSLIYAFPLVARYENTIGRTLRNSFDISIRFIVRTLILLVLVALELFLIFYNLTSMLIGFLIGPAFIMFTIAAFAKRIFQKIEREQKEQ